MRRHPSQPNWFQLLTAAVLCGGIWQAMPVLAQTDSIQIINQVTYSYSDSETEPIQGLTSQVVTQITKLVDPLGQITGCAGEALPDYTGFQCWFVRV